MISLIKSIQMQQKKIPKAIQLCVTNDEKRNERRMPYIYVNGTH